MSRPVHISDGTLQDSGASGITNIRINGALNVIGDVLTGTDSRPLSAGGLTAVGTAPAGTANNFSGYDLADAVTGGVNWAQSYPTTWLQASVSFGYIPLANNNLNIRWEAIVKRVNVIVGGTNNVVTISPQVDTLVTQASGLQNVMQHVFNLPQNFDLHNSDSIFGEVTSITIQRLGGDAADSSSDTMRITNVNTVRNILA